MKEKNNLPTIVGSQSWKEDVRAYREDKEWRIYSQKFSLAVLRILRKKDKSQAWLAEQLGSSPQNISKLLSGKENLSLKTIVQVQSILEEELLEIKNMDKQDKENTNLSSSKSPTLEREPLKPLKRNKRDKHILKHLDI